MDMEDTNQDTSVEESPEIHPTEMKPPTLFLPHDVILEVQGMHLHVRKQVLADNSPVFERMFKSNFKEKDLTKIPLPRKKLRTSLNFEGVFMTQRLFPQSRVFNDFLVCFVVKY